MGHQPCCVAGNEGRQFTFHKADESGEAYGTEGEVRNHEEESRQDSTGRCGERTWSAEEEGLGSHTTSQRTTF